MNRIRAALTLLPLLSIAAPAAGQQPERRMMDPEALEMVRLAEGVYAALRRDPPGDAANANVLVIINEDDVVVVDSNITPSSSEAVIRRIRALTDNPVRYVVTTHWHDDHVMGNGAYRDAFPSVEFISHPYTRQRILDTVAPRLERNRTRYPELLAELEERLAKGTDDESAPLSEDALARTRAGIQIYQRFIPEMERIHILPATMLVSDSLTLHRGEREIHVRWLGRGNTAGDLVVHLPKEGIVATGDLLVHPVPFSFGSYLGEWIETLERVRALGARVLMPGHGELQRDDRYIVAVIELLESMRAQMAAAVDEGLSLEEARARLDMDDFRERLTGGDPVRTRQFEQFFIAPASERAFLEAKGEIH